jgi:hypothetical protein
MSTNLKVDWCDFFCSFMFIIYFAVEFRYFIIVFWTHMFQCGASFWKKQTASLIPQWQLTFFMRKHSTCSLNTFLCIYFMNYYTYECYYSFRDVCYFILLMIQITDSCSMMKWLFNKQFLLLKYLFWYHVALLEIVLVQKNTPFAHFRYNLGNVSIHRDIGVDIGI